MSISKSTLSGWSTTLAVEKAVLDAPLMALTLAVSAAVVFYFSPLRSSWRCAYGRRFVEPGYNTHRDGPVARPGRALDKKAFGLREIQVIGDPRMVLAAELLKSHSDERDKLFATLEARTLELIKSNEELKMANRELEGLSYSTSHVLARPSERSTDFSDPA